MDLHEQTPSYLVLRPEIVVVCRACESVEDCRTPGRD
jgi:hypothetical protein